MMHLSTLTVILSCLQVSTAILDSPSDVALAGFTDNSVDVAWTAPANCEDCTYTAEFSYCSTAEWTPVASATDITELTASIAGLDAGKYVSVRVLATLGNDTTTAATAEYAIGQTLDAPCTAPDTTCGGPEQGTCSPYTGLCVCNEGFYGASCSDTSKRCPCPVDSADRTRRCYSFNPCGGKWVCSSRQISGCINGVPQSGPNPASGVTSYNYDPVSNTCSGSGLTCDENDSVDPVVVCEEPSKWRDPNTAAPTMAPTTAPTTAPTMTMTTTMGPADTTSDTTADGDDSDSGSGSGINDSTDESTDDNLVSIGSIARPIDAWFGTVFALVAALLYI